MSKMSAEVVAAALGKRDAAVIQATTDALVEGLQKAGLRGNGERVTGAVQALPGSERAPYGTRTRAMTRGELQFDEWSRNERAIRETGFTYEQAVETGEFFAAVIQNDQAKLREIEARQTRPKWWAGDAGGLSGSQRQLTTGNQSGVLPQGFHDMLQVLVMRASKLRRVIQVFSSSELSVKVPTETQHASAEVKAELADMTSATQPSFGSVTLTALKVGGGCQFSNELLADTPIALVQVVSGHGAEAIGRELDRQVLGQTGATDFTGSLRAITANATVNQDDADGTIAKLLEKYFALPEQYRRDATWLISDTYTQTLANEIDLDGRPMHWRHDVPRAVFDDPNAGTQNSVISELLGRPVLSFDDDWIGNAPDAGDVAYFGNMRGYILYDRSPIMAEASQQSSFMSDATDLKFKARYDGVVTQPEYIQRFTGV